MPPRGDLAPGFVGVVCVLELRCRRATLYDLFRREDLMSTNRKTKASPAASVTVKHRLVPTAQRGELLKAIGARECCSSCRFWRGQEGPRWETDGDVIAEMNSSNIGPFLSWVGQCRRHSPVQRHEATGLPGLPETDFNEWCGDFEKISISNFHNRALQEAFFATSALPEVTELDTLLGAEPSPDSKVLRPIPPPRDPE
jgi:hypothetical protein